MRRPKLDRGLLDRLISLEDGDGLLTVDRVLEDAASPDSPLHSAFEWDDAAAAHEHRRAQARGLLRFYRHEVVRDEHTLSVHLYVEDPDKPHRAQGYIRTATVATDRDKARRVLAHEIDRAMAYVVRVRNLAEYFELASECRQVEELLASVREAVAAV